MYDAGAHTAAAGAGLHNAGKAGAAAPVRLLPFQQQPLRHRNPGGAKQGFADEFVHGQRAAQTARAGVFDAAEVQHSLQLAVLPLLAVEGQENNVRRPAQLQDAGTDADPAVRPHGLHRLQIGRAVADGGVPQDAAPFKHLLRVRKAGGTAQIEVHQRHSVPQRRQRLGDAGTAGYGNIPLVAESAA